MPYKRSPRYQERIAACKRAMRDGKARVMLKESAWHPIETAPRDGTWVLLKGGMMDMEAQYEVDAGSGPPCVAAFWNAPMDAWTFAFWDGAWRSDYENPTHWRPIP